MIEVKIDDDSLNEFDKKVRLFKKLINKDGVLREVRDRRYYVKPSVKEKLKRQKAAKERRKS